MEEKVENLELEPKSKPSLFGMIWSPGEQFEKIRQRPTIWIAMLIVTLLTMIGTLFMAMGFDMSTVPLDGMSEEQIAFAEIFAKITSAVMGLFIPIISVLISSAIVLAIAKIANKDVTFKQLFSMNTFIYLIPALGALINGLIRMLMGGNPEIVVTSLASLMNSDSAVLGVIELFSIWHLILFAIGLHKVARLSKGASWTIAIVFFLFQIGMASLGAMLSGLGAQ